MDKGLSFAFQMLNKVGDWAIRTLGGFTYSDLLEHLREVNHSHDEERKIWTLQERQYEKYYRDQTDRLRGFIERETFGKQRTKFRRTELALALTKAVREAMDEFFADIDREDAPKLRY